jgi:enediyne biosynthesis protein E4
VRNLKLLLFIIILSVFFNCKDDVIKTSDTSKSTSVSKEDSSNSELFEYLDASTTNIDFQNQITETETFNFLLYEYLYNGGGVAIGDINNDGLDDIYFSGNTVSNKLYLNEGNFKFKDITESAKVNGGAGFKTGVTMADVNNDGFLDIYVCKSAISNDDLRRNLLYINQGNLTFKESANAYGLDDAGYSVQAYFFDSDGDNDLDVYVLNHSSNMRESNTIKVTQNENGEIVRAEPKTYEGVTDRFYQNNNTKFTDISAKAGILNDAFGLSAVIGDFNNDFRPDIYVCNDYMMPDRLLINKGNNVFKDEVDDYFSQTSFSSMGSDFADINNDGHLDLFTLDMSPKENHRRKMMMMAQNYDKFEKMTSYGFGTQYSANALQINSGTKHFSNIAFLDNLAQTEWSWSALFADFDNDGFKDLHITNGYNRDVTNNDYSRYKMDGLQKQLNAKEITLKQWIENIPSVPVPAFLFKNKGNNSFKDVSREWNSGRPTFSNGSAFADLNNDGYLDVVVNNLNDFPFIMKNKGKETFKNNFISLKFEHQAGKVAQGTIAKLTLSDGSEITETYNPTRGFLSSSQHKLHFGFKEGLSAEKLDIIWPDKQLQTINKPEANTLISVKREPNSRYTNTNSLTKYFEDASSKLKGDFTHKENDFIDFKREVLLHHKYSEEGPAVAIADVNGDGLEDIYLGGALGYSGKLFTQNTTGSFNLKTISGFNVDKMYEDTDAVFFDANLDGHTDLYVVSGGSEHKTGSQNYKDRLYLNDGNGNFQKISNALPDILTSGSVVKVHDIDGDGQLDIFIGSRLTPGRYPETPRSYILKNTNGIFKDVTSQWSKGLSDVGMVTDAEFADLDNDGVKELIISGEWMPISVFRFQNGSYSNKTKDFGLENKIGWWNSLTVADVNGDGLNDIIGGNLGLNSIFKASDNEPTTLYYKDFDQNGSLDAVLCTYIDGVSYPIHNRDRMLSHMVMLKKRFTRYEPYASATIEDIFTPEELSNVSILKANHLQHTLFKNMNGTRFTAEDLPTETQISVLNDAFVSDLNKDGKMDIVIGGNFYGTDAEFGRYDASIGATLINKGSNFEAIPASESGLSIPGNVQHVKPISIGGQTYLLVVRNNEESSLLKIKSGL